MSLINEALKRTRDAAYQPVTPSPSAPEYRLDNEAEPSGSKNKLAAVTVIAGLALGAVVLLGWRLSIPVENTTTTAAKQPALVSPVTAPANIAVTPSPTDAKVSEDQIVAKVVEKMKAEQPSGSAPVAAEPPKLILQGITYAREGSDAMINGVNVHEGEDIEGARIVTIESRRVTVDFRGQEIILRLP